MYLDVSPSCGILKPGTSESVILSFKTSALNIENLLKKHKQLEIRVSRMVITYGDQPTRLRLIRYLIKLFILSSFIILRNTNYVVFVVYYSVLTY